MIIVRAPLRISFVGGGTDLPGFYQQYPGRVLSTTIDNYVYLVINPAYRMSNYLIKYQVTENIGSPYEIKHDRFRAAILDLEIPGGIEMGTFADLPAKTGLGSSSSFSVALMMGLNIVNGKNISREEAARLACRLEIDLLKEPIGKQDQYAAAYGGLNVMQFNQDETVDVDPVLIDYKKRIQFESHLLLFFTGITRNASDVLHDQQKIMGQKFETYKQMSDSVLTFKEKLLDGDFRGMAEMLHEGWLRKKSLSNGISNLLIDTMYDTGIKAGAWGGKVLGAGGGGCLLFLAPPDKHASIRIAFEQFAKENNLHGFTEIPVKFTQSGANIVFNSLH